MISFKEDGKKFNFRVGAVILSKDKKRVLLHKIDTYDFYLLPGGRVEWLESTIDAIKRELEEEIGLSNISPKPVGTFENFFSFMDLKFHEVSYNFVVELNDNHKELEKNKKFFGKEGPKYIFEWFDIDKLDKVNLKPEILKDYILNYNQPISYSILIDNKKI